MIKAWEYLQKENFFLGKVRDIQNYKVISFIGMIILIGVIVKKINNYPLFYLHQFSLLAILLISFYTVKKFIVFFEDSTISLNPQITGARSRATKLIKSNLSLLIASVVVVFYFTNIILLKYIEINLMGIYAILLGATALFISIIGYYQFIQLVLYIKKIKSLDISDFNQFIPANTPWLVNIAEQAKYFKNIFFLLGLLFTTEYAILVPRNAIVFNPNFIITVSPKPSFLFTWGGIIIFIIIAFPVYSYLLKLHIKKIVLKLKQEKIDELEKLLKKEKEVQDSLGGISIEKISAYAALIKQVDSSQNYPIKDSSSVNILLTLLTLVVHLTSIATGLKTLL